MSPVAGKADSEMLANDIYSLVVPRHVGMKLPHGYLIS